MTHPRSTYRLQFRNGMDFANASQFVPYLQQLGISHLYASPLMTAVKGSTHGYDAVRADEIDLALGGIDGLRQLSAKLHHHGMGLILDIVPNHMAASLENPWWRSVVVWGQESPFSRHFDIDWREKLTLPFLGKDFAEELADGAIRLALEPGCDALALRYHDTFYPLNPSTYEAALGPEKPILAMTCPKSDPEGRAILTAALTQPSTRTALEKRLEDISADPVRIAAIHAAQNWRLADWKTANRHLTYRRFFEIAGLVGLRVEDPQVFDDSHRLIFELVRDGTLDGLRIDHIDGLADPQSYLERLRAATGPETYIVVEKILEKNETLAREWPVAGTTGYEFIATIADAFADRNEDGRLRAAFQLLRDEDQQRDYAQAMRDSKRQMLTDNFQGEVRHVAICAKTIADNADADLSRSTLTEAICSFIEALPVYRTYIASVRDISERDRQVLAEARSKAQQGVRPEVCEAIDFIWELLTDDKTCTRMPDCVEFRTRFQQLTGPIMAKAVEDTLFYRENALIALNEVGGDLDRPADGPAAFHAAMLERAESWPNGLSTTSTHDTKRGEDARARLYTLSEASDEWIRATKRWSAMMKGSQLSQEGPEVPEADVQWLIYQALAGAWPIAGRDDRSFRALPKRMRAYAEKALREAKRGTNWSEPDFAYENGVARFVDDLFANDIFLDDFAKTLSPFIDAGLSNALAQTLVKLTAPGVPDIYQGSERSDFSLVDPDNRALLDLSSLRVSQKPPATRSRFEDYKQWLVATVLAARRDNPAPFASTYTPLDISDDRGQALAYLRGSSEAFNMTVVPRLAFGRMRAGSLMLSADAIKDVAVSVPGEFVGLGVRSVLDGRTFTLGRDLMLSDVLQTEPVALLVSV